MKPLRKSETKRFEDVCSIIRKALHLDHLEREYVFEDGNDAIASTHVFDFGWRLRIYIKPQFWTGRYDQQVRWLIHEHIHVCLHAQHQASDRIVNEWISPHDRSQVGELNHTAAEIAVDHLTEVFYRLLEDRFA